MDPGRDGGVTDCSTLLLRLLFYGLSLRGWAIFLTFSFVHI